MNDLFVKAALKMLSVDVTHDINVNDVEREAITANGKFLDLLITTDEFAIGIENKIYASLYNDLYEYSKHIDSIASGKKTYKIVLSLNPIKSTTYGFINKTYSDFFYCLNILIGSYWNRSNPRFMMYLNDFMKTIQTLQEGSKMRDETMKFLGENLQASEEFLEILNGAKKNFRKQVMRLSDEVDMSKFDSTKCKRWFWKDNRQLYEDLVHDLYVDGGIVAIDTYINPNGWEIMIWLRKPGEVELKNTEKLRKWLVTKGIPEEDILQEGYKKDWEGKIQDDKLDDGTSRNVFELFPRDIDEAAKELRALLGKLCTCNLDSGMTSP